MANGKLSGGTRERLQAFADHLDAVFNAARPIDMRVLGKLAPHCDRPHMDAVPTPREIHIAMRRLRDSAGGIDGMQACMLKCLARDDQLFFDFIVEMVVEFWETHRLPVGWGGHAMYYVIQEGRCHQARKLPIYCANKGDPETHLDHHWRSTRSFD
jgi:hypothetical protein